MNISAGLWDVEASRSIKGAEGDTASVGANDYVTGKNGVAPVGVAGHAVVLKEPSAGLERRMDSRSPAPENQPAAEIPQSRHG
jgi:hypothetical protein